MNSRLSIVCSHCGVVNFVHYIFSEKDRLLNNMFHGSHFLENTCVYDTFTEKPDIHDKVHSGSSKISTVSKSFSQAFMS